MSEIDLLKRSSFAWVDLFGRRCGPDGQRASRPGAASSGLRALARRRRRQRASGPACLASANAPSASRRPMTGSTPMRPTKAPSRSQGWLKQPATDKQLQYLPPECRQRLRPHPLPRLGADDLRLQQARHPCQPVNAAAPSRTEGGMTHVAQILPPPSRPRSERVVSGIRAERSVPSAGNRTRGFGWRDPVRDISPGASVWFCSMPCQRLLDASWRGKGLPWLI